MNDWMLILSMAALTFLPRYLPFALAGKTTLSPMVKQAISFVPIAVLTVIVVQTALFREGELALSLQNHQMLAALIAFIVAILSRHLFLTITIGLLSFALMEWLLL